MRASNKGEGYRNNTNKKKNLLSVSSRVHEFKFMINQEREGEERDHDFRRASAPNECIDGLGVREGNGEPYGDSRYRAEPRVSEREAVVSSVVSMPRALATPRGLSSYPALLLPLLLL